LILDIRIKRAPPPLRPLKGGHEFNNKITIKHFEDYWPSKKIIDDSLLLIWLRTDTSCQPKLGKFIANQILLFGIFFIGKKS